MRIYFRALQSIDLSVFFLSWRILEDLGEKAFMLFVYAALDLDTMVWWQLHGCALDTGGTKCSSVLLTSPCHTHSPSAHWVLSVEAPGHGCCQTAVTGRGQMFAGTGRQGPHFCTLVADDRTETLMPSIPAQLL